jgi:preprotein translocase subunit SecE
VSTKKKKKLSFIQKIQRFWRETIGELRKVTWPTAPEAWKLTKLVMLVMVLMAAILGVLDFLFSRLISLLVTL